MTRPTCPCRVQSSDRIRVLGSGNLEDPYEAYYKLSEDEGNALVAGPTGLRLLIPTQVERKPAVKAIAQDRMDVSGDSGFAFPVEFDDTWYDTGGMWDSGEPEVLTVPRTGLYNVGAFLTVDYDGDDEFECQVSIQVNDIRRIVQEGPRIRFASASPPTTADVQTQHEFIAGDRLKVYFEPISFGSPAVENIFIREDRHFYASFRGD